jgi:hypothetical protein
VEPTCCTLSAPPHLVKNVSSSTISLDVERSDFPVFLAASQPSLQLETQGETLPSQWLATYADNTVFDITNSSLMTYASANSAIATVDASGSVTAMSAGTTLVTATYKLGSKSTVVTIPVTVQSPILTTSPNSLSFASQAVDTASSAESVTVTNVTANAVSVLAVSTNGDFSETDNCLSSSPLGPNGTCTVNVIFAPVGTGSRPGSLLITNNINLTPIAVSLVGTGTAPRASANHGALTNFRCSKRIGDRYRYELRGHTGAEHGQL